MPIHQHVYKIHCCCQRLAPFGSSAIVATAGAGAWNPGAASAAFLTTTVPIMIDMVYSNPSNDEFDIEIIDTAGTPNVYATVHSAGIASPDSMQAIYTGGCAEIPAGTTLKARVQSKTGGNTCALKIGYKEVG